MARGVALSAMRSVAMTEASTAAGTVTGAGQGVIVVIGAKVTESVTAIAAERTPIAVRPQAMSIWWMS